MIYPRAGAVFLAVILCAILLTAWEWTRHRGTIDYLHPWSGQQHDLSPPASSPPQQQGGKQHSEGSKKYAYATFLTAPSDGNDGDDEDGYFISTRILAYQLLHSSIASKKDIDVIVMVTDKVKSEKRARLEQDGAKVIVVEKLANPAWMHAGTDRWQDMLTKLRLFELTDYDKICYMDSDVLITNNMDGVFDDAATETRRPSTTNSVAEGDPPLPSEYMLAAHSDNYGYEHPYPPDQERGYLNAGFLVFKPSIEVYNYYLAISKIDGRFDSGAMEQGLLNHVHSWSGNMPWQRVWYGWNINFPSVTDFTNGTKSFHDKFWGANPEADASLSKMWQEQRSEMLGYWRGREHTKSKS